MLNLSAAYRIVPIAFSLVLSTLPGWPDENQERVQTLTNRIESKVVEWRRHIHTNPELSNREENTAAYIAERLKTIGVDDIQTGVARHGVVAMIHGKHSGPVVALRADIDALPVTEQTGLPFASQNEGVMHACGHDAHTAILLGTAHVLNQMRDAIHGSVKLIFQPAEEGAPLGEKGGASLMIEENVLKNPDVSAIFALHVNPESETGKVGYRLGGLLASVDQFKVTIHGQQTHAAYPWKGVDPIVTAAHVVTALQTIVSRTIDTREPAVVTVGVIQGGQRWNIIPDDVVLEGTVRTHSDEVRKRIRKAFDRIVNTVCETHGATADIIFHDYGPVTHNDFELGRMMIPTLKKVTGPDKTMEIKPVMGGEDFACFAQEIPGFYVFLGVRNERIGAVHPLHSPRFIADEAALPIGARLLSHLALDYLNTDSQNSHSQ